MRCVCDLDSPHGQALRALFGSLDLNFTAQPLTATRYAPALQSNSGSPEQAEAAVYRYRITIWHNAGKAPSIQGILLFIASRDGGIEYAWETVSWSTGEALTEEEQRAALQSLILHVAAQLLYHAFWLAAQSGDVTQTQEVLHA